MTDDRQKAIEFYAGWVLPHLARRAETVQVLYPDEDQAFERNQRLDELAAREDRARQAIANLSQQMEA